VAPDEECRTNKFVAPQHKIKNINIPVKVKVKRSHYMAGHALKGSRRLRLPYFIQEKDQY
jgi:hypothetical protein